MLLSIQVVVELSLELLHFVSDLNQSVADLSLSALGDGVLVLQVLLGVLAELLHALVLGHVLGHSPALSGSGVHFFHRDVLLVDGIPVISNSWQCFEDLVLPVFLDWDAQVALLALLRVSFVHF